MMRRLLAAVVGSSFLLVGCTTQADVAATEAALEELEAELLARDDLSYVSASFDRSGGVDVPTIIIVTARSTSTDEDALRDLADTLLRATWQSDVPTITSISVRLRADEEPDISYREAVTRRTELEERFGPRDDG